MRIGTKISISIAMAISEPTLGSELFNQDLTTLSQIGPVTSQESDSFSTSDTGGLRALSIAGFEIGKTYVFVVDYTTDGVIGFYNYNSSPINPIESGVPFEAMTNHIYLRHDGAANTTISVISLKEVL